MIMMISPRELSGRIPNPEPLRQIRRGKSAIGMAEMLAHEIKNPLADHRGGAIAVP